MNLSIVCCIHGNERYGLEVAKRLPSPFNRIIANGRAVQENKRFIDADLNRCFPGNEKGNYEERLAFQLREYLKDFDYVLDLHSSSNDCPLFGIITKPNKKKIEFAKRFGLKRLVIMPKSFASGNALIDFVKCGLSLEIGPHGKKENIEEVLESIRNFIEDKNRNDNLELFEVKEKILKKCENILISNFEKVKKGQLIAKGDDGEKQFAEFDFVGVLVGEKAYENILCLACRQVNLKERDI